MLIILLRGRGIIGVPEKALDQHGVEEEKQTKVPWG